ncbi:DUF6096 family protein [Lysinibacillus piscis]|uniref:Phage tail assembly protein n=1 Tax=Lysinibacillus piscis TaxID=2518931 RepID=A0ABQ5NK80_9BACI|nr:DUF6096 family protein [Lysinibacillus sp. KH24]GLC88703.1 hypothetical protein LYSBPC_18300 [Lysinibacillus sp. KH24]
MKYTSLNYGGEEFKLRITAAATIDLEKKLGGRNPLDILMAVESGNMPSISSVLLIFHAAIQKFHHGVKFDDIVNLYDQYVEDGNAYTDLLPVLIEVFRVSGFFPSQEKTQETSTQQANQ